MKTIIIALLLMGGVNSVVFSQGTTFKKPDSVTVLEQRKQLSKELSSLQDSLRRSLAMFDNALSRAKAKDITKIQNAHLELVNLMEKVRLDSVEVALTSVNGWDARNAGRIQQNMVTTRGEYLHLVNSLKDAVKVRKARNGKR